MTQPTSKSCLGRRHNALRCCLSASKRATGASATRSSAIAICSTRPLDFVSNAWHETRPRPGPERRRRSRRGSSNACCRRRDRVRAQAALVSISVEKSFFAPSVLSDSPNGKNRAGDFTDRRVIVELGDCPAQAIKTDVWGNLAAATYTRPAGRCPMACAGLVLITGDRHKGRQSDYNRGRLRRNCWCDYSVTIAH